MTQVKPENVDSFARDLSISSSIILLVPWSMIIFSQYYMLFLEVIKKSSNIWIPTIAMGLAMTLYIIWIVLYFQGFKGWADSPKEKEFFLFSMVSQFILLAVAISF